MYCAQAPWRSALVGMSPILGPKGTRAVAPNSRHLHKRCRSAWPGLRQLPLDRYSASLPSLAPLPLRIGIRASNRSPSLPSKTRARSAASSMPGGSPIDRQIGAGSGSRVKSASDSPPRKASRSSPDTSAVRSRIAGSFPAAIWSRIWARSTRADRSSSSRNPIGTPASSGKRRSRAAQKLWMVWTFSPPGVSMARANRRRASARSGSPPSPSSANSRRRSASGSIAHWPRRRKRRFCISVAAALV